MTTIIRMMMYRNVLTSTTMRCKYAIPTVLMLKTRHCSCDVQNYDIVISGGGLVGTTLACAIANNRKLESKKVLLLEGGKQFEYKPQAVYSNRVVALNQETRTLLSSIGAWHHIEGTRYCAIKNMQVWEACSDAMIVFNEDHLLQEIAYVVENDLLLNAVSKQLEEKKNVNVIYNSKVETIKLSTRHGEYTEVQLQNGATYKTKLLVGADGANSLVRQTMNVQYVKWNYNQMGIVATLKLSEPTENTVAWQRFLPMGPIAMLPLTNCLSSLVWSVPADEAKRLLKISEEEFVDNVNHALWKIYPKDDAVESVLRGLQQFLGSLSIQTGITKQLPPSVSSIVEESRAAFPLQFGHSVSYVQPGTVLVGDAAHRVHPLAGQGVNLGFGDVIVLVQVLADAVVNGASLGDIMYLRKYETLRQRYNVPIMLAIDAMHRLYKGTAGPIVLVRGLVMQLANVIPVIKKEFIDYASGQSGYRP